MISLYSIVNSGVLCLDLQDYQERELCGMGNRLAELLQALKHEPLDWDNEFYVGISRASHLSDLSESQIRYFENLPGITIGRKQGRNREYTKRDVRLLKCVYECKDLRPSQVAELFSEHQEEILEALEYPTLPQLVQHEQSFCGHDVLVSKLIALLLSIWRDAIKDRARDFSASVQGIILGPQDERWKASFVDNVENRRAVDLTRCLIVWSTEPADDTPSDPKIFLSRQACYLPFSEKRLYDTSQFVAAADPFSVVTLWLPRSRGGTTDGTTHCSSMHLDESRREVAGMIMRALKDAIDSSPVPIDESVTAYSRAITSPSGVSRVLSLLLDVCIRPYFSDCFSYVAAVNESGDPEILAQVGDRSAGYLPIALDSGTIPWWVRLAIKRSGVALARELLENPNNQGERGSVVCLPLVGIDGVIGILGVERIEPDDDGHCLVDDPEGIAGTDWLRYLWCVAEIAADSLLILRSFAVRDERLGGAYKTDGNVGWHWGVYLTGGLNYTKVVEKIVTWMEQLRLTSSDSMDVVLIDVSEEGQLASDYGGYDIVADITRKNRNRIYKLIEDDPIAAKFAASRRLVLFDQEIGDHLVLAATEVPRPYLLTLLERIRRFWRQEWDSTFVWKGEDVEVLLQVGICEFTNLVGYEREMTSSIMRFHIRGLAEQIFQKEPLDRILETNGAIVTEKIRVRGS